MSSYAIPHYEEFFQHTEQRAICGGMIENMDGSRMYVADVIVIESEVKVAINTSQPLTVGWAIGLSVTLLVGAGLIGLTTYSLLRGDVNEVRSSLDTVRDGASSDVSSLRTDMRTDFSRMDAKFDKVSDKLDKITEIVTEVKIDQAKKRN
ncbi:hypothetical protein [Pantoea ananatis]|uniref:hypothetical protein n=1 Tax=Pantoea ananas TaxID=553 RepID=UPI001B31614B|nr:hypothetical protein [Pantoea ananatis]